jgi:hypothetical protein
VKRSSIAKAARFYGSLSRTALADFSNVYQAITFWVLLVVGMLAVVVQPLAQRLSLGWQSLSPVWGVALVFVVLAYALGRANYRYVTELEGRLERATPQPGSPRSLTDSVVGIEQQTLPVTDEITGAYVGTSLCLRFTNRSDAALRLRCRLINLERELPNGEPEPEDWFRERWLLWSDEDSSVEISPGAHRDCEVTRMSIATAIVTPVGGGALPRSLLPGRWIAVVNVETEGFAVRRLAMRFEWRTFTPPYSAGRSLRWLPTT